MNRCVNPKEASLERKVGVMQTLMSSGKGSIVPTVRRTVLRGAILRFIEERYLLVVGKEVDRVGLWGWEHRKWDFVAEIPGYLGGSVCGYKAVSGWEVLCTSLPS